MNYALMHQSQIPLLLQDMRNEILLLYLSGSWVKLEQFIGVEIRIGCQVDFDGFGIFVVQVNAIFAVHVRVFAGDAAAVENLEGKIDIFAY